jgi:hypothetical protein
MSTATREHRRLQRITPYATYIVERRGDRCTGTRIGLLGTRTPLALTEQGWRHDPDNTPVAPRQARILDQLLSDLREPR